MKLLLAVFTFIFVIGPGLMYIIVPWMPYELSLIASLGVTTILSVAFLLSRGDDLVL